MPDQKVMRVHYQREYEVTVGDIIQCPHCRKKYVVMPESKMLAPVLVEMPGGSVPLEDFLAFVCPFCDKAMTKGYYERHPVELPPRSKPKEAKPDGQPRSRKGTTQQRSGKQNRSKKD